MCNKIVVVKIGSKVLVSEMGKIRLAILFDLAKQISRIHEQGFRPIIVTSGAIACGNGFAVGAENKILNQQVAAMVGQPELMAHWRDAFNQWGLVVGQGLGTHRDFSNQETVHAIHRALDLGIIPILNENDLVSAEEIRALEIQGDNDALAAIVAKAVGAARLILLSDVEGLYDRDSLIIPIVERIDESIMALASLRRSARPTGMGPKLVAAKEATDAGIVVNLANGNLDGVVTRIVEGRDVPGTVFLAQA